MNKIIIDFLNSDLTEAEYFNIPKEDLISLKEYLTKMRARDAEFKKLISEPLESMKNKCGWVNTIAYSPSEYNFPSTIHILSVDDNELAVHKEHDDEDYKNVAYGYPKFYLLNKRIRTNYERSKELEFIQEELSEIDRIGSSSYNGFEGFQYSASGNFAISYSPEYIMSVLTKGDDMLELVADFPVRKMKYVEKPYLSGKEKEKVLTKVQIKAREI